MEQTTLNCTVLGDAGVGKTTLLLSLALNMFSSSSLPTCINDLLVKTTIDDKPFTLKLYDTPGGEWDAVRLALYPTRKERLAINPLHPTPHVVLVCFSVVSPGSLVSVQEKWVVELKTRFKRIPWLLVGTKVDLRQRDKGGDIVDPKDGMAMAESLGSGGYVECTSFIQEGVEDVLREAVRLAEGSEQKAKQKERSCLIQ